MARAQRRDTCVFQASRTGTHLLFSRIEEVAAANKRAQSSPWQGLHDLGDDDVSAGVGTAIEDDKSLRRLKDQALFMGKVIRPRLFPIPYIHLLSPAFLFEAFCCVGHDVDIFFNLFHAGYALQTFSGLGQETFSNTDVLPLTIFDFPARLSGRGGNKEICAAVDIQEGRKAVRMIVVGMREHSMVDAGEVNAKPFCIAQVEI